MCRPSAAFALASQDAPKPISRRRFHAKQAIGQAGTIASPAPGSSPPCTAKRAGKNPEEPRTLVQAVGVRVQILPEKHNAPDQWKVRPPSTGSAIPVMNEDSSDVRNRIAAASSSGWACRPSAYRAVMAGLGSPPAVRM